MMRAALLNCGHTVIADAPAFALIRDIIVPCTV
jgi:hypothetical protein